MWVSTSKGVDVFKNRRKVFTFHTDTTARFIKLNNGAVLALDITGISEVNNYRFQLRFPYNFHLNNLTEAGNCVIVKPAEMDSLFILDKDFRFVNRIWFPGNFKKDANKRLWYLVDGKIKPIDIGALEKGQLKLLTPPGTLDKHNNDIADFYLDKDGYYWLSKYSKSLTVIDRQGLIHQYTMNDGLPANELSGFVEDSESNVWVIGGALIRFGFKNLHLFNSLNGLVSTNCWSIAEHKPTASVWILQSNGITGFYNGKFSFYPFPKARPLSGAK
jgi:ligand-binding sensor domain-containing protein